MRRVFFSFDWDDVWKANQVRNSWVTKGNYESAGFVDAADIEKVKRYTDDAIKRWIDKQLNGTSVTCVLIGSQTSNSKWVNYEIQESIKKENGLLGVYIHNIRSLFKTRISASQLAQSSRGEGGSPYEKHWTLRPVDSPAKRPTEVLKRLLRPIKGESPFSKPPMNFFPVTNVTKLIYPCCSYYDWVYENGYKNLGNWIEIAAQQAGR